jgi:hypothetical protein
MKERETPDTKASEPAAPEQTPPFGRGATSAPAQPQKAAVDTMPFDRSAVALMTPEQRSALYLNQIRKMLIFFTVLTVVGLVTGIIVGIVGIQAIEHAQTCTGFGC